MKKVLYLILSILLVGCASKKVVVLVPIVNDMVQPFTLNNLMGRKLPPDSLIGSTVSISSELTLKTTTGHRVLNGTHVFKTDALVLTKHSRGHIEQRPLGASYAEDVTLKFYPKGQDTALCEFDFELVLPSRYVNISTITKETREYLKQQGATVDVYGYLRNHGYYYVYDSQRKGFELAWYEGMYHPGSYLLKALKADDNHQLNPSFLAKCSTSTTGYIMYSGHFLVRNKVTGKIFLVPQLTTLEFLYYRNSGVTKRITTD